MSSRTFFTSDLHFGHENIIKYCKRPWATVQEMDEALIANWNSVVGKEDEVWNLGDAGFCCSDTHLLQCLKRLNGKHHFVMGNHDIITEKLWLKDTFLFDKWCFGYQELTIQDQNIVLCHYAMREWHHNLRGTWHLFGHTHGLLRPFGKSVDVGVDNGKEVLGAEVNPFRPYSFEEVKKFMDTQNIGPHAQFGGEFKVGENGK